MILVHHKAIQGCHVGVFVSSMAGRRMEISVLVGSEEDIHAWQVEDWDRIDYESSTGRCGVRGLLEIRRVMPDIVAWIRRIGYTPVASPADPRRRAVFGPWMAKWGIKEIPADPWA